MSKFEEQLKTLENKIKATYEEGVTQDEAEKLAAEFLHAQMVLSAELRKSDLDSRMKKAGNKSVRATAYLEIVSSSEKKPTEAQISALIETDSVVSSHQDLLDKAEVLTSDLERYYAIFSNAHVYYRGVARGNNGL